MEKLQFDSGVKEYRINGGGVLRFNPGDPNLYARFLEAADKLQQIEQDLAQKAQLLEGADTGTAAVKLMAEADQQMKQLLSWVFGQHNDFDKALGGVNLLAVAGNGERVVTNLLQALQPVLVAGAETYAAQACEDAVKKAQQRRASQQ